MRKKNKTNSSIRTKIDLIQHSISWPARVKSIFQKKKCMHQSHVPIQNLFVCSARPTYCVGVVKYQNTITHGHTGEHQGINDQSPFGAGQGQLGRSTIVPCVWQLRLLFLSYEFITISLLYKGVGKQRGEGHVREGDKYGIEYVVL